MSNQVIYFYDARNKTRALPALFPEMAPGVTRPLQIQHIARFCRVSPQTAGLIADLAFNDREVI